MPGRIATYVIPAVAVVATAIVLLGPGAARPVFGARVRGSPAEGASVLAVRLEGVRRIFAIDDAAALDGLVVEATGPAGTARWEGATGTDGIAEAALVAPGGAWRGRIALRAQRNGLVLADGAFDLPERRAEPPRRAMIAGTTTGDLRVEVEAVRGAFAAPFWDALRITVGGAPHPAASAAGVVLELGAVGADLGESRAVTGSDGSATVSVRPQHHQVELSVAARDVVGRTGRWEGGLPVVPGAIWLDPGRSAAGQSTKESAEAAPTKLRLVSPSPRDRAYVSIFDARGRIAGAVVTLAPDVAGFHSGEAELSLPARSALAALVAGDPFEQGAGTTAWPLRPTEGIWPAPKLELLLDGLPGAEAREKQRAWHARRLGIGIIALGALIEAVLLVALGRRAQRRLEAHLASASAGGTSDALSESDRAAVLGAARERRPLAKLAVALALVALGFALVAALAWYR